MILSNRVHNVGINGHRHATWVPAKISRFDEASAPHLPLPARDEQGLRDERAQDASASGMIHKLGSFAIRLLKSFYLVTFLVSVHVYVQISQQLTDEISYSWHDPIQTNFMQSLLLFSRSIDANGTFSRMVFDQWLELRFGSPIEAQEMMWRAAKLRTTWQGGTLG